MKTTRLEQEGFIWMSERERIEPSKEAIQAAEGVITSGVLEYDCHDTMKLIKDGLTSAYAIDFTTLQAERDQLRLDLQEAHNDVRILKWAGQQTDALAALSSENSRLKLALQELAEALREIVMGFGHRSKGSAIWEFSISDEQLARAKCALASAAPWLKEGK